MPNFGSLIDKAKHFAVKHPKLVNKGISEAEKMAEKKMGAEHEAQVRQAGEKAEGFLGTEDRQP